ncbi:diguanylate cyclase [Pararhizobium sp. BT-229]|uniref:diguanylate cyclase n=1 Tax=Pararhizobium sp. BT-229 TaxID=2986923 RepID=UPI0021F6C6A2|nr:diguanylate cyclase [Pararhizobium sp. BT-229]MCV9960887.1 diguanylate cyclase [Pararhizobium sp. BT-229]
MLLIEDSRMFATVLKHGLETAHGVEVTHCSSLTALTGVVEAGGEYCVAVLDLNLPDAPNCEALDYVISQGIAAIVFTGSFNNRTREDILSRNVIDCVIKSQPDCIGQVISLVDRALTNVRTSVLLVDSVDSSRAELLGLLRQQQFRVTQAGRGAEALNLLDVGDGFDLVVTDIALADMSAYTLLSEIRQRHGEDTVSVIALAETADRQHAARFLQSGGTEFIQKPFLLEEFNSRIFQVANIQKRIQALHGIAARDYLTDIYNRRYFFQHGPRMVEQCLRRGETTSIAILDIDHFKRLNDTYGHEVGDLVLKAVAKRLRALVGEEHLLARLGGEEFGILFNGLDVAAANGFCETLRLDLAKGKITADDEELSITVSIGLATIEGLESFENYLNAADQFLYMAKYDGRNRIVSELTLLRAMAS